MRAPFNAMQDGVPGILLDPSCRILAEALASRVCYKEQVSGLEKVTVDLVSRPHNWGDAFMALGYLLCSTAYSELREFVRDGKRVAQDRRAERGEKRFVVCEGAYVPFGAPTRGGIYDEHGSFISER
jgi:hypothetical protein